MTDDPNADLVGYAWEDDSLGVLAQFEVTGSTPGLPSYVDVTRTDLGTGSSSQTCWQAGLVRQRKLGL